MLEFTIIHKFCGCERRISGYNVFNAFKSNNLDINFWIVKNIEKV